jgi:hypothetical protein
VAAKEEGGLNGSGRPPLRALGRGATTGEGSASPDVIVDLADACVRYVERAIGVKLDYAAETLPIVDHYLEQGRSAARERRDTVSVLAQTLGAYFGEVVRRRYACWWRCDDVDPASWQIELEPVYLSFSPVQLVYDALTRGGEAREAGEAGEAGDEVSHFEIQEEDREAVAARLNELPPVSENEYFALSTRLEVIDIVVEAIRARRMGAGETADAMLTPDDYE